MAISYQLLQYRFSGKFQIQTNICLFLTPHHFTKNFVKLLEEMKESLLPKIAPKPVFLFAFSNRLSRTDKEKLDLIVTRLGGISKISEDLYVRDATHIIVPDDCGGDHWCPKIVGALAAGKTVLKTSYLVQSAQNGYFLPFLDDYIPACFNEVSRYVIKFGRPFKGQVAKVVVKDRKRGIELRSILRDGGAEICHSVEPEELVKIDVIYTDDVLDGSSGLEALVQRRLQLDPERKFQVLSYFSIFKIVQSYPKLRCDREVINGQFDVRNLELMAKLHPKF